MVYRESDMDGFWADSESSDNESTMSSDMEISEMVKYFYVWSLNSGAPHRVKDDL